MCFSFPPPPSILFCDVCVILMCCVSRAIFQKFKTSIKKFFQRSCFLLISYLYIFPFRHYMSRYLKTHSRYAIVKNSGLHSYVFTDSRSEILDEWIPDIFYRLVKSVFLDSQHDFSAATRAMNRLFVLSFVDDLIPFSEYDVFGGDHPNQFFLTHGMVVGREVVYRSMNVGSPSARPFVVQTVVYGIPMVEGSGISYSAARLDNLNHMRGDSQFTSYCREVKNAHLTAYSIPHYFEELDPVNDPELYLCSFFSCSKKELEDCLQSFILPPIEVKSQGGIPIRVHRVLSVFLLQGTVKSLYLHRSKAESNRRNLMRYCASLLHSVPVDGFIRADHSLLSPQVLEVIAPFYPRLPFPFEILEHYIPPDLVSILLTTPPTSVVDKGDSHPSETQSNKRA